ncbi:MAG: DNA mismatch endonuclease Vsr [Sphingomonadales bacterium]|nr:DNA mismatch endonuclease Vsr [Sphingomonadales bacterium]
MTDVHDVRTRSRNMAAIRSKDTKPELLIRKGLHAAGFRFRLHVRDLSGKPDLVLRRHRAVIFVNGCFWHGHECAMFKYPAARSEFWREKIGKNVERDTLAQRTLLEQGWRVCVVWECALRGRHRLPEGSAIQKSLPG